MFGHFLGKFAAASPSSLPLPSNFCVYQWSAEDREMLRDMDLWESPSNPYDEMASARLKLPTSKLGKLGNVLTAGF
jgi:hypothetical protein